MVLGAYFDESMRTEGNEPICVGGYFFKPAAYVKFKRQWHRSVLRHEDRRFAHFHMKDLCAGREQYQGLEIPARVQILDNAIEAITAHSYGVVGIHFDQAEFERVAPADWPQRFGSIYSAACQMCLHATGRWLREWRCPMKVLYVFERGHTFQNEADRLLTAIGKDKAAQKQFRYKNHVFEYKEKESGLQAADLFVWTITKTIIRQGVPRSFRPFLPSILRLGRPNAGRQKIHQLTGDKLSRFINDQANATPIALVDLGPRKRAFR
jgi:Protein of unknown function (DUF3800)